MYTRLISILPIFLLLIISTAPKPHECHVELFSSTDQLVGLVPSLSNTPKHLYEFLKLQNKKVPNASKLLDYFSNLKLKVFCLIFLSLILLGSLKISNRSRLRPVKMLKNSCRIRSTRISWSKRLPKTCGRFITTLTTRK